MCRFSSVSSTSKNSPDLALTPEEFRPRVLYVPRVQEFGFGREQQKKGMRLSRAMLHLLGHASIQVTRLESIDAAALSPSCDSDRSCSLPSSESSLKPKATAFDEYRYTFNSHVGVSTCRAESKGR